MATERERKRESGAGRQLPIVCVCVRVTRGPSLTWLGGWQTGRVTSIISGLLAAVGVVVYPVPGVCVRVSACAEGSVCDGGEGGRVG